MEFCGFQSICKGPCLLRATPDQVLALAPRRTFAAAQPRGSTVARVPSQATQGPNLACMGSIRPKGG